jgi:hypothetical protein
MLCTASDHPVFILCSSCVISLGIIIEEGPGLSPPTLRSFFSFPGKCLPSMTRTRLTCTTKTALGRECLSIVYCDLQENDFSIYLACS